MSEGIFNALTAVTEAPYTSIGAERTVGRKTYRYLQSASTSGTIAATGVAYTLAGADTVTDDVANSDKNLVAGVAVAAVAAGYYGWFCIKGNGVTIKTDTAGSIAGIGYFIYSSTTGTVTGADSGTTGTVGVPWAIAEAAETAGTVKATINIM